MQVKRSSMLPGNGAGIDWDRLSSEVAELDDLAAAVAAFGEKVPPEAATVRRWQELPTAALVALAQAGHRDAFDPLYRRYSRAVRTYAESRLRIVGRTAYADDVASLTWMKALNAIGRYQPRVDGDPFKAWLLTIARYECARMMDRLRVETPVSDDTETALWDHRPAVGHAVTDDGGEVPETAEKLRMLACLRDGVSDLPADQQTVIRLRLEGAALCDVARLTGWNYRRVTRVWEAAQHALRARLTGGDDDLFADRDAVRAAAATLPAAQREVVLMRLDGMRECDIVRATGRSKKAVSGAWERAKRTMRDQMAGFTTTTRETTPGDLAALREAAATLPAAQRDVALMRLDGMRSCDIVRATGRSTSAVANAWDRARKTFARHGLAVAA
ncbi:RNA polymerase sigma factor [Micromonospora sp. WMMD1274]|uniref:RNA polymerase sigma factor n=1 Tax=Micromonospora sp. WMMD1274 TaxID=3404116 RepID=UPI003B951654